MGLIEILPDSASAGHGAAEAADQTSAAPLDIDVRRLTAACEKITRLKLPAGSVVVVSECRPGRSADGGEVHARFFLGNDSQPVGSVSLYAMNRDFDFNRLYMAWLEFEIIFGDEGKSAGFWWLDDFRKDKTHPRSSETNLSAIADAYFKAESNGLFRSVEGFYMFPAAYGPQSEAVRLKIVAQYAKYMSCEDVPGAKYLKYLPLYHAR
jgi:hypothetical protein